MIYTVKSVGAEPREWSSSHGGTFLSYSVDLENEDGLVEHGIEWTKKPESRAPAVGERVAGHIEPGKFSEKFKIDYEATKELGPQSVGGGGSERSSGGAKGNWQPEQDRDPERSARILRQHSQSAAIELVKFIGETPPAGEWTAMWCDDFLKPIVDWFDADVIKAGQAARQGQVATGSDRPEAAGNPPVNASSAPVPASPPANTEQRDLEMAIDGASAENLSAEARAQVAAYMLSELDEADRSRAFSQLTNSQDPTAQGQTIRAMKARTEKWTGAPLPIADVDFDDSLPF